MAAKKKSARPRPKVVKASPPPPPHSQPQPSASPPLKASLFQTVFMAVAAFAGGLLTPPSLHALREGGGPNEGNSPADVAPPPFPLPARVPCTPSNLDDYLHASPVPGLHVVCVEPLRVGADGEERPLSPDDAPARTMLDEANALLLTFYRGSHAAKLRRRVRVGGPGTTGGGVSSISWHEIKGRLIQELELAQEGPTTQPWAAFTATGERIVGEKDDPSGSGDAGDVGSNGRVVSTIAASGMIVVAQGGNWRWPGVREGFRRAVEVAAPTDESGEATRNVTVETLSLEPLVVSIEGFLTDDECDYIARKAGPSMRYSSVSLKDADKGKAASNWRTSQSTFLTADGDPILTAIDQRTASLTRIPKSHQEFVQVLRYGTSEKYDAHHDYFDPAAYRSDRNTLNLIQHGKKNRFATVFWYLTDVDDGGHTVFPRAGGLPPVRDHADCSRGLKVQPRKGKVIIFYSLNAAGRMDPLSLHGACPVGEGNVKWAANKWIWNDRMNFVGG